MAGILGIAFASSPLLAQHSKPLWTEGDVSRPPLAEGPAAGSFAPMLRALRPAVVNIYTKRRVSGASHGPHSNDLLGQFFGHRMPQRPPHPERSALGSGFLLNADGNIVTNHHVVANATDIQVRLHGGEEYEAHVVGRDESTDLALLKINADRPLEHVVMGDSDRAQVGDWVVAIGNPMGLQETVTAGIVSGRGRSIGAGPYDDFIQTDASINPGNSGGPLFNLRGEVIGVNTAIYNGAQGIGFAIPANLAKSVLSQIAGGGVVHRGWLGVGIQSLTPDLARGLGVNRPRGAVIAEVFSGSPAEASGVLRGDVVVGLDGHDVSDANSLTRAVGGHLPGDQVRMDILREGETRQITVRLGDRGKAASALRKESSSSRKSPPAVSSDRLGLTVRAMTARERSAEGGSGVVVEEVLPSGVARMMGVREGDRIIEVNRKRVDSPREFTRGVAGVSEDGGGELLLLIRRGRASVFVAVTLPPS